MKNKNIIIFTDIGDDIDDSLALTYLLTKTEHEILGIVTRGPPEEKLKTLHELLDVLEVNEKPLIVSGSESADKKIDTSLLQPIIDLLPSEYEILSLGPMTDISSFINATTHPPTKIYSQGTVFSDWTPSDACYNYKNDMEAANHIFNQDIPHSWVDKDLSYQYGISESSFHDFSKLWAAQHHLYQEALYRKERFKKMNPSKYTEIYKDSSILSHPYDLLTAIALDKDLDAWRVNKVDLPDELLNVI